MIDLQNLSEEIAQTVMRECDRHGPIAPEYHARIVAGILKAKIRPGDQELLGEIAEALESRGFAHYCNGDGVGKLCDALEVNEELVTKLQTAIRKHMNMRGDDRCTGDDTELYAVLPEGDTRPARETAVTIENCQRYIECRQNGREYVSPQRRIEELESQLAECYRLSGADPDGNEDWRLAEYAVEEVRRMRKDCDDYSRNLGDIVTYGTTADVLDQHLGRAVEKNRQLEKALRDIVDDASDGEFPDLPIVDAKLIERARELLK